MKKEPLKSELYARTLRLLKTRSRNLTLEQIATDTKLNKRWLEQITLGLIDEPSVAKVETLYNYLSLVPLFERHDQ